MPELGNGLTIDQIKFSASGTITGTNSIDNVSASSTTAAGDTIKFEFNAGEDNVQDDIGYNEGGGKSLVKIINFKTGTDKLSTDHERARLLLRLVQPHPHQSLVVHWGQQ